MHCPGGGRITIARSGANWKLDAHGDKVKIAPELWKMITNPVDADSVSASDVHFALVRGAAADAGRSVATYITDSQVTLTF